jgi:hypothetical protein
VAGLTSDITAGTTEAGQTLSTNPDASVSITPSTAGNQRGTTRTLTISVAAVNPNVIDAGTYTATAVITNSSGAIASFLGGNTCTYSNASPTCTVALSSAAAGSSSVKVTTTVKAGGVQYTRTTGTAANTASGGSGDAAISWVDAGISIAPPTDTSAVGTTKTFTVSVSPVFAPIDSGNFTITAAIVNDTAGSKFEGASTCSYTASAPSCTFAISAANAGTTTVHASTTVSVAGVAISRSADYNETWVDGSLTLSLPSGDAPVNSHQTVTITAAAVNGTLDAGTYTATASIGSPGSIVGSPTCTYTKAQPSCGVTVTSASSGSTSISATSTFKVSGVSIKRTTGTAPNVAAGGSGALSQTWAPSGGGGGGGGGTATIGITMTPRSQTIAVGGTAFFAIAVTNTGGGYLFAVGVTDGLAPNCAKTSGDIPDFGALAPGVTDTWNCSVSGVQGSFTNTALVSAQNSNGDRITATDSASVTVDRTTTSATSGGGGSGSGGGRGGGLTPPEHPRITITKTPRMQTVITRVSTHKLKSGKRKTVYQYGTARFSIRVANSGDVALTAVSVSDPKAPACSRAIGRLAAGASKVYTCSKATVTKRFTNVATAKGTSPRGRTVRAASTGSTVKVAVKGPAPSKKH